MDSSSTYNPRDYLVKGLIIPKVEASKTNNGFALSWRYPKNMKIVEYGVFMAVNSAPYGMPGSVISVSSASTMLLFEKIYWGPNTNCEINCTQLKKAHTNAYAEPAIVIRLIARTEKGYIPATEVRYTLDFLFSRSKDKSAIHFKKFLPDNKETAEVKPLGSDAVIIPGELYLLPKVTTHVEEASSSSNEDE